MRWLVPNAPSSLIFSRNTASNDSANQRTQNRFVKATLYEGCICNERLSNDPCSSSVLFFLSFSFS